MKKISESESDSEGFHSPARSKSRSISEFTNCTNLDAEKILEKFGTYGAYQMFTCIMANAAYILYACESMIFSLIIKEPEFTCNQLGRFDTNSDQCVYFDPESNSITKCSNFSYTKGKHAYVTSEFDLVCDNAHYGEHILFLFMLGSMFFTPILTQLADLYGRKVTYLIPLWLTVIANIGCSFASNYILFVGFILLAGIAVTGLGTIRYVMVLEAVAPAFRSYTFLVSTLSWVVGYTMAGIVHMYIESWRWQLFALAAPFILTLSYYWLLPESIHWLVTHNKTTRVKKWIRVCEKVNRKKLKLEECRSSTASTPIEGDPEKDNHKRTFLDMFSSRPMVFQLVSHCYIMIVMNFTYWALSFFSTDFHENKMMGYFLSGFVEISGVGAIFLLAYFGRKTVTSFSLFAQAVAMCIAVFYPGKSTISMILFLLVKGFNNILWVSEPLLMGEMAPTSTRNIFCGFVGFIGKIGSITAPYFNYLKAIHELAPAVVLALFSLVAGLLALCSPETMNIPMPEDIDEFDPGPVYCWIFGEPRKNNNIINIEIGAVQ